MTTSNENIVDTKIIALFSTKGGSGKSTMAIAIAACLNLHKRLVALIDTDSQASVYRWSKTRDEENRISRINVGHADTVEDIETVIGLLMGSVHVIVIDVPGHDTEVSRYVAHQADVLAVPIRYGPDLDAFFQNGLPAIRQSKKPFMVFFNAVKKSTNIEKDLRQMFANKDVPVAQTVIHDFVAYPRTFEAGNSPYNLNPYMDESIEIKNLTQELMKAAYGD